MRAIHLHAVGTVLALLTASAAQAQGFRSVPKNPSGIEPPKTLIQVSATMPAPNPVFADAIARMFRESGQLSQYRIQVIAFGNNIELYGDVASEAQHDKVIQLLRTFPGIGTVHDWIQVRPPIPVMMPIQMAQAPVMQPLPGPAPGPDLKGPKLNDRIDGQLPEPTPIFQAPQGPNPAMQPPPLPPYAWPTYAPYNNLSRVAYPNAYPYEQWPFIGPMYPFPRVPLGWRSVSLTWDDGHWWFHRNPTGHDWWRIRYW